MDVREFLVRLCRYVVLLGALGRLSIAGTIDPSTPDSQYIEFGKQFPCVVKLRNVIDCDQPECGKTHEQLASAVIIRPNWILTAAHAVKGARHHVVIKDNKEHKLAQVILHNDFKEDDIGFHDIALGYTAEDFKLEFYTPLYSDLDEQDKAITIAGFGNTGTFFSGATKFDDRRRAGHNQIESFDRAVLLCSPSKTNKLPLEFMIGPGDSGGGMFIGDKLAGISSFILAADKKPDGTYGDESAFTRMSLYADWVELQIQQHELALSGRATLGATPVKSAQPEEGAE